MFKRNVVRYLAVHALRRENKKCERLLVVLLNTHTMATVKTTEQFYR